MISRASSSTGAALPERPDDGLLVGSPQMLQSPNVVEPTNSVNQVIKTPSIYCDGRGEIHNISINDDVPTCSGKERHRRLNILYTKQGVKRSGDIHANHQCDFIFSGTVEVWTLEKDGSTKTITYGPKQYIEIPPYVPHVFNFVEDTIMAEWWEGKDDGATSDFRAWFYKPYRSIVDESFTSSTRGRMKMFGERIPESQSESNAKSKMQWYLLAVTGGIALYTTLSFVLGSRFGRGRR